MCCGCKFRPHVSYCTLMHGFFRFTLQLQVGNGNYGIADLLTCFVFDDMCQLMSTQTISNSLYVDACVVLVNISYGIVEPICFPLLCSCNGQFRTIRTFCN